MNKMRMFIWIEDEKKKTDIMEIPIINFEWNKEFVGHFAKHTFTWTQDLGMPRILDKRCKTPIKAIENIIKKYKGD